MRPIVAAYGERLLVHASRGLVPVRGTACSADAVALIVIVGSRRAQMLRWLGVAELSDFYLMRSTERGGGRWTWMTVAAFIIRADHEPLVTRRRNSMFTTRTLGTMVAVLVGALAVSRPMIAQQDCGLGCRDCASQGWEGYIYNPQGPYHMTCLVTEESCYGCGTRVANSAAVSARSVAEVLSTVGEREMAAVVAAYGFRILVDEVRGLAVVQGQSCNPEGIETVVFLTTNKVRALRDAGAGSLRAFLLAAASRVAR